MPGNTTRGITYPLASDPVTPLEGVFKTLADSTNTALDNVASYREIQSTSATALAPGSTPTATLTNGVLALGIPTGATGSGIKSAVAQTLAPGSSATASVANEVLTIGIPTGATGQQGPAGVTSAKATQLAVGAAPTATVANGVLTVGIPTVMTGTGSPEGVVTASPGAVYMDTAGTNGAWQWVKRTGTAATGWAVAYGFSGIRNINSLLQNGVTPSGGCRLIRANDVVTFTMDVILPNPALANSSVVIPIPDGFKAPSGTPSYLPPHYAASTSPTFVNYRTEIRIFSATPGSYVRAHWTWATTDPWPTTLPGVAG